MPVPQPTPEQACGATNRQGKPCKNWPAHRSTGVKRRCRFHGGHSLQGLAHPGYRHGFRSRSLRALGEIVRRGELISIGRASVLTRLVQAKRSELVTLASAIADVEGMTRAEIREYLGLPLSPGDVVIR